MEGLFLPSCAVCSYRIIVPILRAASIMTGAYSRIVCIVSRLAGPETDRAAAKVPLRSNIGEDNAAAPSSLSSKLVA
jgi:hypothetical protein